MVGGGLLGGAVGCGGVEGEGSVCVARGGHLLDEIHIHIQIYIKINITIQKCTIQE